MDRFDPFVKYADVYGDIINWEKDPMNKPQNQNKYFFSDGKTYYEQICKMLRLMSVFKEAFNQIYSNEDEISEAWENFVNNLSASVVEGSEPDVTLTWTDDSVNFEFTMVPGVPGEQGVGITSISFNSDYTMTITLSDGNSYTSMSLKGETGPQGPQGETGSGLQILDVYATLADLQSAHPTGQPGDAYQVGSAGSYTLYIWSSSQSAWVQAGTLGTVSPYTSAPLMDGTASAGSQNLYARGDHVHPSDTSRASKEELDALIKTSQSLIDQSFTYRESPAIQDGLARINKIKGNTLVWNQLISEQYSHTFTAGGSNQNVNIGRIENIVAGHKYLYAITQENSMSSNVRNTLQYLYSNGSNVTVNESNETNHNLNAGRYGWIFTAPSDNSNNWISLYYWCHTPNVAVTIKDAVLIDLTLMFGVGNEPTTDEEFASLFPLPFYDLNNGSLLSLNGTGIKLTGKNLCTRTTDANIYNAGNLIPIKKGQTIYWGGTWTGGSMWTGIFLDKDERNKNNRIQYGYTINSDNVSFITSNYDGYFGICFNGNVASYTVEKMMIAFDPFTLDEYEPYKESTLSLPISQYFPNGMRSAGNVHDELTPAKSFTRIGVVDLGTLTWSYLSGETALRFFATLPSDAVNVDATAVANAITSKYPAGSWNSVAPNVSANKMFALTSTYITIRDTSYTDATVFKNSLSGVMLYYELATPTETAVDLDLSFNAYENGTEQLLPVNGSVPSTSPIIADMTYLSIDDAMEYIIDKLANVPLNTQQILDSLGDDVADLQTDVGALQPAVSGLQTSVGNINTNIGQLSSTVAGHTASISGMQSDITDLNTGLSDLEDTVTDNTSRIGTLETGLTTTNGNVQNLETSVSDLDDTVTAQGTTVTALDSIIQDISNNPVVGSLGSHELGFVAAYVSATLAANTGTKVTIPKPTIFPNNYTPLFIVGMTTGSYNVSICEIPYTFGTRDSVDCRVWNHGGQQTTQITVYILCMRQRQSQ